jgi:hypothetical protein
MVRARPDVLTRTGSRRPQHPARRQHRTGDGQGQEGGCTGVSRWKLASCRGDDGSRGVGGEGVERSLSAAVAY